jgi:hypothetical protein
MRDASGLAKFASKIMAALLGVTLLVFSLIGPLGVITSAYADTATTETASSQTLASHVLIPAEVTDTSTDTSTDTPTDTPVPTDTPTPVPPTDTPTDTPVPTDTPTPVPPTPTPIPPTPTPIFFTPTPVPTEGPTPAPKTKQGLTPVATSNTSDTLVSTATATDTPTATATATETATPDTSGADQTPTPGVLAISNNKQTPPGTPSGGGPPLPLIAMIVGTLLIFGLAFAFGLRSLLRKSMSPVPQAKLGASGARTWNRLRGISMHGFTGFSGIPLVEDRQTINYNIPFQADQGNVVFDNQAQAPFGSTFPTPDSGFAPMDVPQMPFGGTPPQSTRPLFVQQGGAPTGPEGGFDSTMQVPGQNALFSEDELRWLVQDKLIVPPEQRNQEER